MVASPSNLFSSPLFSLFLFSSSSFSSALPLKSGLVPSSPINRPSDTLVVQHVTWPSPSPKSPLKDSPNGVNSLQMLQYIFSLLQCQVLKLFYPGDRNNKSQ
ncbi:hypothetical protein HZ326_1045 [Fusarium oxysporum f. sp. albedinis]|nr:hypothetical protein HZ326_1045 [Fusarium oxysporum f. sp. albedinis]